MLWRPGPDLFMDMYIEIIVDKEMIMYTKMLWRPGPDLFTYIYIRMMNCTEIIFCTGTILCAVCIYTEIST
jgi:hypothetical protein